MQAEATPVRASPSPASSSGSEDEERRYTRRGVNPSHVVVPCKLQANGYNIKMWVMAMLTAADAKRCREGLDTRIDTRILRCHLEK